MKNAIPHLTWRIELKSVKSYSIGQDFILFGNENSKGRRYSWIPLNTGELDSIVKYFGMFKETLQMEDNPNRPEIIKHLVQAFFYSSGYYINKIAV